MAIASVGAGGALGACLRWTLSTWLNARWGVLPLGTLTCNLIGGLAIGLLAAWFASQPSVSSAGKLFWMTGLLGGLTTFSTFSLESIELLTAGEPLRALVHVTLHVVGSIAAAGLGFGVMRWLLG
ncbi:MAG: fluoride efflux transporter CrcB [Duodenibacillus sp.]|nr:fluoride efflux transporter CrcB [Duodenibacillus sp.]